VTEFAFTLPSEAVEEIAQRAAELVLEQLQRDDAASTLTESPFMTIHEAAEYLRCKRGRIDNLLSEGRLTRYKDGGRTLLLRAELDARLAGELVGPLAQVSPSTSRGRSGNGFAG
jgi:excisionase family DNA binding protein